MRKIGILSVILSLLGSLLIVGCGQSSHQMTQQEAIQAANQAATAAGYKLDDYAQPQAHHEVVGDNSYWSVSFVEKVPTGPGAHFQVWVDEKTGKAEVKSGG